MKKSFLTIILAVIFIASFAQKKILFDNTKSETAGNADWIIDDNQSIPSPAQSEITQSTTEDYWQGALSSWGVEMVKRGYYVETLPSTGLITYDNTSNSQDLSNYDIFVVCEPNNPFSSSEKQAMIDFVENGGGLFIVADHAIADRDGDGWDALEVWNDFFSSYSNPFGFTLDAGSNVSKDPATNVANLPTNTILHGEAGDVDGIAFYNGGTFTIDKNANSTVIGLVYYDGYSNTGNTGVMAVCATYGNGRVVGVGDSSVAEDETAHDASHTYPGWSQPLNAGNATGDDGVFITNATIWLGESSTNPSLSASSNSLSGFSYITGNGPSASQSFSISGSNLDGSIITVNAPSNYEISSNNTTFNPTIEISYSAPTLVSTTLYVRLKSGLTNATYNESITVSDNGSASNISISLSGEVSSDVNIISENFTNCPPSNWTIYSVTSNKNWSCNNQAMSINAYNGDVASNDWLISPALDLSAYSSVTLNFDSWTQYSDAGITNPEVKLKYSTNYPGSGNPESYTWTELSYSFPAENSQSWTNSDDIDLSALAGSSAYIAFQYSSSGTGGSSSSLWQVDNVSVLGQLGSNQYTISASAKPSGSGSTTGSGNYNDGATVTLTATANTGYIFNNWTENENIVSTNATYQFTVNSNRTLVANFNETTNNTEILNEDFTTCPPSNWIIYSVTSNKDWSCDNQAMLINAYNGDVASNDWLISPAMDFSDYSTITLSFDSWTQYSDAGITNPEVKLKYSTNYPGNGDPNSYTWNDLSYSFPAENSQSWTNSGNIDLSELSGSSAYIAFQYTSSGTGGGTSTSWQVDNVNIIGQVESNQHTISTSVNPSSSGSTAGSGSYDDGATVTLTATANTGYSFTSWTESGSVVSTNATYQFTAREDRSLIANFTANSYTVSASVEPTNSGTISGTGSYNYGTTATLIATANTDYAFTNWTENGTVVSTNSTYSFTVDHTRTLVANFTINTFNITASVNPANAGSIGGSGEYNYGATATLTASTNNGYTFLNWTENDTQVSTSTTYSFTVTDDRNLIANFEVQTSTPNILSSSVKIYPNPSSGIFTVEIIDNENINHIEITDISGKILQKYKIESSKIPVDISKYYNGIYFIHIINNNGSAVKKIVKQ